MASRSARRIRALPLTVALALAAGLGLTACTGGSAPATGNGSTASTMQSGVQHPSSFPSSSTPMTVTTTGAQTTSTGPTAPTASTSSSRTTATTTALPGGTAVPSLTPLTPDGLATGPGVDGTSITLGVLVDPAVDRGFTEGLALWQRSANDTGGICGRSITLTVAGSGDVPAALPAAYRAIGRHVLGLITLPDPDDTAAVDAMIGADQIPALTPLGTSAQLAAPGPIVIGPTADIVGINTFAYLDKAGLMPDRTLGVLSDGSAMAADALNGLRWAAGLANVTLTVLSTSDASPANWGSVRAVVSLAGPADTDRLLAATVSDITVMTSIDGYEPTGLQTGWAARLLVATPTPAFGSDHPAATAAAKAFTAAGGTDPGPRLLIGYATGTAWGRLLAKACSDLSLTRSGVDTALTEIGPAAVDSLLGPSDPGVVVSKHLPATRLSAVAQADPTAPAGLKPLTWLEAAPNIANYIPTT